jgi:hypothetical protein
MTRPTVIVESNYEPPLEPAAIAEHVEQARHCLEVRECVILAVYAAENGRRVVYLLTARDAERARNAFRSAGVPFERAWAVATCAP